MGLGNPAGDREAESCPAPGHGVVASACFIRTKETLERFIKRHAGRPRRTSAGCRARAAVMVDSPGTVRLSSEESGALRRLKKDPPPVRFDAFCAETKIRDVHRPIVEQVLPRAVSRKGHRDRLRLVGKIQDDEEAFQTAIVGIASHAYQLSARIRDFTIARARSFGLTARLRLFGAPPDTQAKQVSARLRDFSVPKDKP